MQYILSHIPIIELEGGLLGLGDAICLLHRCKAFRWIRRLAAQLTPPIVYAVLGRQGALVVNCIFTINILIYYNNNKLMCY